jgi:hypothetical protein
MQTAEYLFEKYSNTRYILRKHTGTDIADFPAVWVQEGHPNKGEKHVVFTDYWGRQSDLSGRLFTHILSFRKKSICLNFANHSPRKGYGEYCNLEVLVQFSDDMKHMTIQFIKKKGFGLTVFT